MRPLELCTTSGVQRNGYRLEMKAYSKDTKYNQPSTDVWFGEFGNEHRKEDGGHGRTEQPRPLQRLHTPSCQPPNCRRTLFDAAHHAHPSSSHLRHADASSTFATPPSTA